MFLQVFVIEELQTFVLNTLLHKTNGFWLLSERKHNQTNGLWLPSEPKHNKTNGMMPAC
jgi:hypothetical protein